MSMEATMDTEAAPKRRQDTLGFGNAEYTPAMWELVLANKGLACKTMMMRGIPAADVDDLYAEIALPAMLRAARHFDPARGRLSTLMMRTMFQEIGRWRNKQYIRAGREVLVDDVAACTTRQSHGPDTTPDTEHDAAVLLACLSEREAMAVRLRIMDGRTLSNVGELMGIATSGAAYIVNAALAKLRRAANRA